MEVNYVHITTTTKKINKKKNCDDVFGQRKYLTNFRAY